MILVDDLKQIAMLAHIKLEPADTEMLTADINAIMNFAHTLHAIDTAAIEPLHHPLHLYQRLRPDIVKSEHCIQALEKIAPSFSDGLYLVPAVLNSEA